MHRVISNDKKKQSGIAQQQQQQQPFPYSVPRSPKHQMSLAEPLNSTLLVELLENQMQEQINIYTHSARARAVFTVAE